MNGSQLTVMWYVGDLKISHVEKTVVDAFISDIENFFGEMTGTTGNEYVYVSMHITITDKQVKIHNIEYIRETIELFGEPLGLDAVTPAKSHLFDFSEDHPRLSKEKHKTFHSCVAKLLFVAKRGRPDIFTVISFLTTRATKPTIDNWGKLERAL